LYNRVVHHHILADELLASSMDPAGRMQGVLGGTSYRFSSLLEEEANPSYVFNHKQGRVLA
jgi:hypothetical protein